MIGELESVWITAPPVASLPGYVFVIAKRPRRRAVELSDAEAGIFWRETMAVAKGLYARLHQAR